MLTGIRQRTVRFVVAAAIILMMVGAPMATPAYADCSTGTSSCST